jgi:N-acetylmuramoyl-L-alanine amidase
MHYTGSQSVTGAITHLTNPKSEVSAHFVIGNDGQLFQLIPCNVRAWHAGESAFEGRHGVNAFSIGIELSNPGPVTMRDGLYFDANDTQWRGAVTNAVHKRKSVQHSAWAAYPPSQLAVAFDVVATLASYYPITALVGHDDITDRKIDPGPAFPMVTFQAAITHSVSRPNNSIPSV